MPVGSDLGDSDVTIDTHLTDQSTGNDQRWCCLGHKVPRTEIVFATQVFVVFVVVVVSLYNITTNHPNLNLWTILLSSSLGYILPNPRLETRVSKVKETPKNPL